MVLYEQRQKHRSKADLVGGGTGLKTIDGFRLNGVLPGGVRMAICGEENSRILR